MGRDNLLRERLILPHFNRLWIVRESKNSGKKQKMAG